LVYEKMKMRQKEKCLVLGRKGMLGHILVEYLNSLPRFEVYSTTREKNDKFYFDALEDIKKLEKIIEKIKPNLVVNCIGIVNSLITEKNKDETSFINSYFPKKLANICKNYGSKLVHISTDCVFSGKEGNYTEESPYSPTDFYGSSKAEGEIKDNSNLTIRTSIIGPEIGKQKTGLMEWFFSKKGQEVKGFKNAIWSGLTTLELAKKIVEMYEKKVIGIINIVSMPISKYDLLQLIRKVYRIDIIINADQSAICNRSMKSTRQDVTYFVPPHEKMLQDLKQWGEKK